LLLACAAFAQGNKLYLGRWDVTITPATGSPYPGWMELTEKDGKIDGRYQPRGGQWRPIGGATVQENHLIVSIAPAGRGPGLSWDFMASGKGLTGVEKRGETDGPRLVAVRAPELKRPMPKNWGKPEPLFNGKDLTGWEPIGNVQNNKWIARDGELV